MCFITFVNPFLIHWSWLRITPFTWFGNRAHGGCYRSTGDAYFSSAPDPTSSLSRGPNLPDLYFIWDLWDWSPFIIFYQTGTIKISNFKIDLIIYSQIIFVETSKLFASTYYRGTPCMSLNIIDLISDICNPSTITGSSQFDSCKWIEKCCLLQYLVIQDLPYRITQWFAEYRLCAYVT
jgi:hypothetical protein